MAIERTLSIIKPNAMNKNITGKIIDRFEAEGLHIAAIRKVWLSKREAEGFYAVHQGKPFFGELTDFMSSGPCIVMVLEGENAIARNREIMGATNPANAAPGTIRALWGDSLNHNTVHGSDAPETAKTEIAYFFSDYNIY